ncbi:hypothetical protein, partial [Phaeobacter inhibens]|uniref:hypothetical protein n=1 Tax=Phaeobacter inhibens TaxID=221822 RepID=UPI00248F61FB
NVHLFANGHYPSLTTTVSAGRPDGYVAHRPARFIELGAIAGDAPFLDGADTLAQEICGGFLVNKAVQVVLSGGVGIGGRFRLEHHFVPLLDLMLQSSLN